MKFEVESRLDDLFGETEDSSGQETSETKGGINNFLEGKEPEEIEVTEEPEFIDIHEEGVDMDEGHPLENLKSTVLSIDWEITDEVMSRFVNQVEELKKEFKDNKIYLLFLQLLGSVGVYIKTNRGKADPGAFKVLGSAFKAFDDVVSLNNMPSSEKKRKLSEELEKFKELKKKIAAKKQAKKSSVIDTPAPVLKKPVEQKVKKTVIENDPIELVVEARRGASDKQDDVKEIVLNPIEDKPNISQQDIIHEVLVEMKKFIRGEFDDLREELRLRKKRR